MHYWKEAEAALASGMEIDVRVLASFINVSLVSNIPTQG
jgi:hypothetical protein